MIEDEMIKTSISVATIKWGKRNFFKKSILCTLLITTSLRRIKILELQPIIACCTFSSRPYHATCRNKREIVLAVSTMNYYELFWIAMNWCDLLRIAMNCYELRWIPMNPYELQWVPMNPYGSLWIPISNPYKTYIKP